ncbi:hypothetical protein MPDQ_002356 [Monascus purpureus]|uniref:4Fe-4S Mo/W bis-MGD-type domain-containing protein n=1 Tax=Monascus purpureus TaxID=5098 RepID=A0A507QKR6_MONPU|nr:hypothetical protein MPDQ_002356 [Monascus purpureus]BDD63130.1 hypothetical protein MAP00_008068 [Monascus purpureus]
MASTQTVLWSRILDRLDGPKPPKLVVVDPRKTQTAKRADVHLAPKVGTNVALLNGIQCLLFQNGWVNDEWVSQHTCGVEGLKKVVEKYTPDVVEEITGVPSKDLEEAARIIGTSKALVSTALQGVYQSNQATAAACQINNINLLRGLIGKPGSGVFQMNSQPTAQNNREAGCNCEFPAFRNHKNPVHMQQLADLWNIEYRNLPHWAEPTPIMTLLDYMEKGSVEMLWVSGTNPLVSLPDLSRIREILSSPHLFLVCQDIFLTETAAIADVVIPAAQWGEKIGTYTNADRTVHLSEKAVDPPGQARSDLEIFLDFGNRMTLKDKDGNGLLPWRTAEEVFEAWKLVSKGRPCDYSGLTYDKLRGGSGIQWPCNEQYPLGKERLFEDGIFNTDIDYCESFGHDLETGVPFAKDQYLELNPRGRAILKWSPYVPPIETPDEKYPLLLNTGREALHSDTREKTGRSKPLQDSCPEPRVQISESDAARFDVKDGEMVLVRSRRGVVEMPVSIGDIMPGQAFIPFHFGYFDSTDGRARAANELTVDQWDPVSKQPTLKGGTVRIEKLPQDATDTGQVKIHARERQSDAMHRVENSKREAHSVPNEIKDTHQRTCRLETWLAFTVQAATDLFEICKQEFDCSSLVSDKDIYQGFRVLSHIAMTIHDLIQPFAKKYGVREMPRESISRRLRATLFPYNLSTYEAMNERADVLIVLRRLYVPGCHVEMQLVGLQAASEAMGDEEFRDAVLEAQKSIRRILEWMRYVMSIKVPQLLLVPIRD